MSFPHRVAGAPVLPNCSLASPAVETAVGTLLALECGLGLPGNAVALWTFFRLKVWRPQAVYLFNLVVADLLLAFCLPVHAAFYLRHRAWGLGHAACRALLFLLGLSRGVGVVFLAAVALDRYLRVLHPRLKVNLLSPRAARSISVLVWLVMVALTHQSSPVPEAAQNATDCSSFYPRAESSSGDTWSEALFFLHLVLPFGLIVFCNVGIIRTLQKRLRGCDKQPRLRRTRALVTAVLLLFTVCFLPGILARVLGHVFQGTESCPVLWAMVHLADVTGSLATLHSVLSPAVYCFSNPAFTHSYRKVFSSLRGRRTTAEPPSSGPRDSPS